MKMKTQGLIALTALLFLSGCTTKAIDCKSEQFKCDDKSSCLPLSWKCDGANDCADGSDEFGCVRKGCASSLFTCNNGNCILMSWKCDGHDDCGDNSDENKETCPQKPKCEFKCGNGKCLDSVWVCDGHDDCEDNSDETNCGSDTPGSAIGNTPVPIANTPVLPASRCLATEFQCRDNSCLPIGWRCDGSPDCDDRSDEQNCPRSTQILSEAITKMVAGPTGKSIKATTPLHCLSTQFKCHDGSKCITSLWKCDSFEDCADSSDEEGCVVSTTLPPATMSSTLNPGTGSMRGLSQTVCGRDQFPCSSGSCTFLTWKCDGDNDCGDNSDEKDCARTDFSIAAPSPTSPTSSTFSCPRDQFRCHNANVCIHNKWVCDQERDCTDGSDEEQCVTDSLILVAVESSIKSVSENFESINDVYSRLSSVVALDVDIHLQVIYWSDPKRKQIRRGNVKGKYSHSVITTGLGVVEGIAVDWVGRKLYWTDSLLSTIEVSELRGHNRKKLIGSNLSKPRAIAVHPMGYLFWTEWGTLPRLSRCSLDGKHETRRTLIDQEIVWPNALTIDYSSNTLWWADAKLKKIESCDLNGSNRRFVVGVNAGHPFSIAVNSKYVFWTNWKTNTLDKIEKDSVLKYPTRTSSFKSHPLGVVTIYSGKQKAVYTECLVRNGGCSHLCLLSSQRNLYSCACPAKMQLGRDEKTCRPHFLPSCSSKQFRCDEDICIDASNKCDGKMDCLDNTDEQYCLSDRSLMIFGNRKRHIALFDMKNDKEIKIIDNAKSVTGIDIDIKHGFVYWADSRKNAILKSALKPNGDLISTEIIADTYVFTPEGLAFDWITNKIYWIDSLLRKIEVIDIATKNRYVVVHKKLSKPRSIALHPKSRHLFWTDWGKRPCVATISMDGDPDTRRNIVETGIVSPNAVTIDYEDDILYWADAHLNKIEKMDLNGQKRTFFVKEVLSHPFALTVFNDYVYWSEWHYQGIFRVNKKTGLQDSIVKKRIFMPMELVVVDKKRQQRVFRNPCAVYNGGCSHLCLLSWSYNKYTCRCPKNMQMKKDRKTCENLYTVDWKGRQQRLETNSLTNIF